MPPQALGEESPLEELSAGNGQAAEPAPEQTSEYTPGLLVTETTRSRKRRFLTTGMTMRQAITTPRSPTTAQSRWRE